MDVKEDGTPREEDVPAETPAEEQVAEGEENVAGENAEGEAEESQEGAPEGEGEAPAA